MHQQDLAIVKALVSVAWADGRVAAEEQEVIDALLEAFRATPTETRQIRAYGEVQRAIDDVPINDLSAGDRRTLLQHAVLLTFIDGEQHEKEREILEELYTRLRIPESEAQAIMGVAEKRAKELVALL